MSEKSNVQKIPIASAHLAGSLKIGVKQNENWIIINHEWNFGLFPH